MSQTKAVRSVPRVSKPSPTNVSGGIKHAQKIHAANNPHAGKTQGATLLNKSKAGAAAGTCK
jgi:hypothetical protein